ncbi:hypothetical protein MHYP_G00168150 [Metynnis hypsauchen]
MCLSVCERKPGHSRDFAEPCDVCTAASTCSPHLRLGAALHSSSSAETPPTSAQRRSSADSPLSAMNCG